VDGDGDFELRDEVVVRPARPPYVDAEYTERVVAMRFFRRSDSIVR
jgi:hypothetical protein